MPELYSAPFFLSRITACSHPMTKNRDPLCRLPLEVMYMVFKRLTYADCQHCITLNDRWRDALLQWPCIYQRLVKYNYDLVKKNVKHVRKEWITEMDFLLVENMYRKLNFIVSLHCSNIREIKIRCKGEKTMTKLVELLKQTGDKLQFLQLEVTDDAVSLYDPIQQVFEHCPNLVYFDYEECSTLVSRSFCSIMRGRMTHEYPIMHHLTHLHLRITDLSTRSTICTNIIKYTPSLIQFSTPVQTCPPLSTLTTACPKLSAVFCESVFGLSNQLSCVKRLSLYKEEDPLIASATSNNDSHKDTACMTTLQTCVTNETLPYTIMRSLAVNSGSSSNIELVRMIGDHSWPQLTTMYLSRSSRLSCRCITLLVTLVKDCPNLIHLGLSAQRFVNDENVVFIMKNMPRLTWLQLVGPSDQVSSEKLVQLVQCEDLGLNRLHFDNLYQVNDDVLDALIATRSDTLITLSLGSNLGLTTAGIQRFVDELKGKRQLRQLVIDSLRNRKLSSILKYARSRLPNTLVMDTMDDLFYIKDECPL